MRLTPQKPLTLCEMKELKICQSTFLVRSLFLANYNLHVTRRNEDIFLHFLWFAGCSLIHRQRTGLATHHKEPNSMLPFVLKSTFITLMWMSYGPLVAVTTKMLPSAIRSCIMWRRDDEADGFFEQINNRKNICNYQSQ